MASKLTTAIKDFLFGVQSPPIEDSKQVLPLEQKESVNLGTMNSPAFRTFILGSNFDEYPDNATFPVVAQIGFERNSITYKCVMMIAQGVAGLQYNLFNTKTGEEIDSHPLLDLMKRPNPLQGRSSFLTHLTADLLLDGNAFVERVMIGRQPGRLWAQRPDMVQIVVGSSRLPISYVYTPGGVQGGNTKSYPVDPLTGDCDLLHLMSYAPLRENTNGRGLSPIRSAWLSVLTHNVGSMWNYNLIKNGARPSGVLQSDSDLTEEQVGELRSKIAGAFSGGQNAGKVPVLTNGLKWTELSLTPAELSYLEGRNSNARDIATALNVPPILLNLPGDATFNNYAEAKMVFYEENVIPRARQIIEELNRWLVPLYGNNLELRIDEDAIPALSPKRVEKWTALGIQGVLTINEKRALLGFEPFEGGDELLVPSNMLPIDEQTIVDEGTAPSAAPDTHQTDDTAPDDQEEQDEEDGNEEAE